MAVNEGILSLTRPAEPREQYGATDALEQGERTMKSGIYFNAKLNEIVRVADEGREPGDGWRRISPDVNLRLLATRRLLAERGLVTDPTCVYWSMPDERDAALTNPLLASCPLPVQRPGVLHRVFDLVRSAYRPLSRSVP